MFPLVGRSRVVSMFMVVDFPAPFGPRKAKISPAVTEKEMWSTAVKPLKIFVKFVTFMIFSKAMVILGWDSYSNYGAGVQCKSITYKPYLLLDISFFCAINTI